LSNLLLDFIRVDKELSEGIIPVHHSELLLNLWAWSLRSGHTDLNYSKIKFINFERLWLYK
tara:strand:- start:9 stop:191 length:183 start_codon:yes stop_codon:yes gene_type:complete